jgi:hypothetical protein
LGNVLSHCSTYNEYKVGRRCARQVPSILTPASQHFHLHSCKLHPTIFFLKMSAEADLSSNVAGEVPTGGVQSVIAIESEAPSSTSSSTMDGQAMVKKQILSLYEFWKALTVTDEDITNFHAAGWLPGVLLCTPTTLDFPTVNCTNIVYFESHMMCGLYLPPSKFFVSVLNYLGCELVHLHSNVIAVLNCFSMLCEC